MRDLLVITPSRGRPGRLAEMLDAALGLSEAGTDVAVALDDDDPAPYGFLDAAAGPRVLRHRGPRDTLTGWTNRLAREHAGEYGAFASLGDDHVPRTAGWDRLLLGAVAAMGGTGIAYGNDLIWGADLPTAPVVSADVAGALGWLALPCCAHMCIDLAWKDIGAVAGIRYVPEVTVEHVHWSKVPSRLDETYREAEARHERDREAYAAWRAGGMAADLARVAALRGEAA